MLLLYEVVVGLLVSAAMMHTHSVPDEITSYLNSMELSKPVDDPHTILRTLGDAGVSLYDISNVLNYHYPDIQFTEECELCVIVADVPWGCCDGFTPAEQKVVSTSKELVRMVKEESPITPSVLLETFGIDARIEFPRQFAVETVDIGDIYRIVYNRERTREEIEIYNSADWSFITVSCNA